MALSLVLVPIAVLIHIGRNDQVNLKPGLGLGLVCLLFFFFLGFASALDAYSIRYALYEWSSFLLLFVMAWVIAHEIKASKNLLFSSMLIVCGLGCVLYLFKDAIIYTLVWISGEQADPGTFIFGFDNYRFFNHTQTISLPILALLVMRSQCFRKLYWFWFVTTSLWWMMLLVSGGRGTFVGLMAGAVITLFFRRKFAWEWCQVLAYTFLAGGIAYLLLFTFLPLSFGLQPFGYSFNARRTVQHLMVNPTNNRAALWCVAWKMISEHPWLGAGPLHFAHYANDNAGDAAHPHNWILQIASEWGVPALVCLMAAISLAYKALLRVGSGIRPEDQANQATLCAWLTIGAAILVDGLVSGLIVMPVSQLWIALFIGCAWGWSSSVAPIDSMSVRCIIHTSLTKTTKLAGPSTKRVGISRLIYRLLSKCKFLIPSLLFAATVLLWRGLYPEIANLPKFEANAMKSALYTHQQFRPRIWLAGYF